MDNLHDHQVANEQKWSQRSATYDAKRFAYFRFMQKTLIAEANITVPSNFLDLGCGTGWAVGYVAQLFAGQGKCVGVDIAPGMIERAQRNAAARPNVEFYAASAEELPCENDTFDTIICSNSFHHYVQPEKALKEVQRVLKPHGRIHILDVTADDFFIRWIDSRVRAREKEHVKFYSTLEYAHLFARAGLTPIRSRRVNRLYPLKVHVGGKENETAVVHSLDRAPVVE